MDRVFIDDRDTLDVSVRVSVTEVLVADVWLDSAVDPPLMVIKELVAVGLTTEENSEVEVTLVRFGVDEDIVAVSVMVLAEVFDAVRRELHSDEGVVDAMLTLALVQGPVQAVPKHGEELSERVMVSSTLDSRVVVAVEVFDVQVRMTVTEPWVGLTMLEAWLDVTEEVEFEVAMTVETLVTVIVAVYEAVLEQPDSFVETGPTVVVSSNEVDQE